MAEPDDHSGAQAEARGLEARMAIVLEAISDGVVFLNHEFRFTYLNPVAERFARAARADLIGQVLWD
ncbi:MAG: PAS domain-containing protein, partial [Actinobacteria bacterium]|nr:PAS domain-containing protein [Actinomycetota bacterium]